MNITFEWATYPRLLERDFFLWTKELYELEQYLKTPIPDSMHWTRRFEYPWILSKLYRDTALPNTKRSFIDVGAGATALQFLISSQASWSVDSIDPDTAAIAWVNSHKREHPHSILGGFPTLPFKDNEYDVGICISVLEHLPKAQVLPSIQELLRVSRKEVLITMDVCLQTHPVQTDLGDFDRLRSALGVMMIMPGPNTMAFHIDGYDFNVACLHIVKG
jgi:SAM-dependent methyltransferase